MSIFSLPFFLLSLFISANLKHYAAPKQLIKLCVIQSTNLLLGTTKIKENKPLALDINTKNLIENVTFKMIKIVKISNDKKCEI